MTPQWWSQPYPPDGTTASEGIRKQLGTPTLDPLVVMFRETAQNSWDARREEEGSIRLEYRIDSLDGARGDAFRSTFLPAPFDAFNEAAVQPGASLVLIGDRGTSGLGGPLRSDVAADEPPDFVNLLRNVGERRDRKFGGGTYGFGKGSLFRISRSSTVLVDTLCRHAGTPQRRLMAASLGPTFQREGRRYTGRHWWGTVATDDIADPLLDADADVAAALLGLRGFADGETGTDIYVLHADLGQDDAGRPRSSLDAGRLMASAAAWYLWPKLVERGSTRIDLALSVDGVPIQVPDPGHSRRIRPFVKALRRIDAGEGTPYRRQSAPRLVGDLAIERGVISTVSDSVVDLAAPFEGPSHHCARMRHVELVVDYLEGPPLPEPDEQYGAVFRASDETEGYFSDAEPPTHDAWVHQHLTGTAKGVVVGARTFVRKELGLFAGAEETRREATSVPLGRLSSALARMLPAGAGDGGGGGSGAGSGSGGVGVGSPFSTDPPRLVVENGDVLVTRRVVVQERVGRLILRAEANVAVDGGRERQAPVGGATPQVLGWRSENGTAVHGPELCLDDESDRVWVARVRPAPLTSTTLQVRQHRSGEDR